MANFDEIFGVLGAAIIRDENPAPHDMVSYAAEYLAGDDSNLDMAEEAINYLMTGNYDPTVFLEQVRSAPAVFSRDANREELYAGLRAAMNV